MQSTLKLTAASAPTQRRFANCAAKQTARLPPARARGAGRHWLSGGRRSGSGDSSVDGTDARWPECLETSSLQSLDRAVADKGEPPWRQRMSDRLGRLLYEYFNWRQGTWSDLQLFVMCCSVVFLAGAVVQGTLLGGMDESVAPPPEDAGWLQRMWYSLYSGVLLVVLGQDLPDAHARWPSQLFAVFIAIFGLASFALVLALTEQFVLEILERNVERGSRCYEQGHTVVAAWCESSRDVAQLTRILTQLCAANRAEGGGVVVVLTQQRGKLEMEQLYREVVPEHQRLGTKFVFRQGSPLDPASLHLVSAPEARRIIVCSDYSRAAQEADAQVLRASVLLDEMIQREYPDCGNGEGPVIVAQVKTQDALPLLRFACSDRVIPLPTSKVNARRYVRLLHNPIATVFSRNLTDFYSPATGCIDRVPEVEGLPFGQLFAYFPDAAVVGLHSSATGECRLNPPPDRVVEAGDCVVLLRPGSKYKPGQYCALREPLPTSTGDGWDPSCYAMRSRDEQPLGAGSTDHYFNISPPPGSASSPGAGKDRHGSPQPGSDTRQRRRRLDKDSRRGLYVLPVQYSNPLIEADELLICGWMGQTFMWELLSELDHSDQGLPVGSRVTLFNSHNWDDEHLHARCQQYGIRNLRVHHVRGDPRTRADMQRLVDVTRYKAAIVVCDTTWAQCDAPDTDAGLHMLTQAEMLSLDAAMLMVQLNIRLLLEEARHPAISIICEKLTYLGCSRFEDDTRPPVGIAVNSASYAAKAMTKVAVEPRFLSAYMQLGVESDLTVQDASALAAEGEELSYLQLQARAASVRQCLLGWYCIPTSAVQPIELVVNPQGAEERSKVRVWNNGDWGTKLVTLAVTRRCAELQAQRAQQGQATHGAQHAHGASSAAHAASDGTAHAAGDGSLDVGFAAPGSREEQPPPVAGSWFGSK